MCTAIGHVRFTPNSDRESGHQTRRKRNVREGAGFYKNLARVVYISPANQLLAPPPPEHVGQKLGEFSGARSATARLISSGVPKD
jgi:hypothetical protein